MKTKVFFCFFVVCLANIVFAKELSFQDKNFFIKEGYISRQTYNHFDDTHFKDEYQDEVYSAAYELSQKNDYTRIYDIGCGSGYKLMKYFYGCETVGYEIQPTLDFLLRTYSDRVWKLSNFKKQPEFSSTDIIVCADVVEHLVNPDLLLNWIAKFDFKYLVISTPDRDQMFLRCKKKGRADQIQKGPPLNTKHVREWNFQEFKKYIGQYFDIVSHMHPKKHFWGQIIIAKKNTNKTH